MAYSNIKDSSRKHHIYYTYSSLNTHMIHKSLATLKPPITSLQIINYFTVIFHYYPRINSQSPTRNRSQDTKLWRSETALLAVASWSARLASSTGGLLALASWGRTESEQYWVLSAFFTFSSKIVNYKFPRSNLILKTYLITLIYIKALKTI